MKTINEAAKENCKNEITDGEKNDALFSSREGMQQLVERTFKNGVGFAQEWIGFEKELPKVLMEIIVKDFRERKHKRVVIPQDNTDIKYLAETFTHWRPVERI